MSDKSANTLIGVFEHQYKCIWLFNSYLDAAIYVYNELKINVRISIQIIIK